MWAKLTGNFQEFFKLTEYVRQSRHWKAIQTYNEWFNKVIGEFYNSKNKDGANDNGEAVVIHDYMRFSWPVLLTLVAKRNWHVMPVFLMKNGMPLLLIGGGLGWMGWMYFRSPPVVVPAPVSASVVRPVSVLPAKTAAETAPVVSRRMLTWLVLLSVGVSGCRLPSTGIPPIRVSGMLVAIQPRCCPLLVSPCWVRVILWTLPSSRLASSHKRGRLSMGHSSAER